MYKVISSSSDSFDPLSVDQENPIHYIPQLTSILNINSAKKEITDSEPLQLKLNNIYKETENINAIISRHLETISEYKSEEQATIYTLYNAILIRELESIEKNELLEIIKSPLCFVGFKASLELLSASITYPIETHAPFERWLNTQVVNYMNTVVTKIVGDINEYVFFNAEDQQSAHQKEPVLKYLDEAYNLYQGQYPDDVYNSLTPLGKSYIKESIKRVNNTTTNGGVFSLKSWTKAIVEQLNSSESVPCCAAYIYELGMKAGLSTAFKEILVEITEEISEDNDVIENIYIQKSDDKYKPTPKLLELILKHRLFTLADKECDKEEEATTGNDQVSGSVFCLRHGIKEEFIRAAHGPVEDIKAALETKSHEWDIYEKVLFLHIVTSRFKDESFLDSLMADQRNMFSGPDPHGNTPLLIAAIYGHVNVIQELLEGLPPEERLDYLNVPEKHGLTPLHIAAENGHNNVLEELLKLKEIASLEQQDYLNIPTNDEFKPLYTAAANGHASEVEELLKVVLPEERLDFLKKASKNQETPLYIAAKKGHGHVIKRIFKELNENDRLMLLKMDDDNKCTPLHIAVKNGQVDAIKELLNGTTEEQRLAYLKLKDDNHCTPLHLAVEKGNIKAIKELFKELDVNNRLVLLNMVCFCELSPLHFAAQISELNIVNELLAGLDVKNRELLLNMTDVDGDTPLHTATYLINVNAIEELLNERTLEAREKYLNVPNIKGDTALYIAIYNGNVEVIEQLLEGLTPEERLAFLNKAKIKGEHLLVHAKNNNHQKAVNILNKYGIKYP